MRKLTIKDGVLYDAETNEIIFCKNIDRACSVNCAAYSEYKNKGYCIDNRPDDEILIGEFKAKDASPPSTPIEADKDRIAP